jgi:hypothetical protein
MEFSELARCSDHTIDARLAVPDAHHRAVHKQIAELRQHVVKLETQIDCYSNLREE